MASYPVRSVKLKTLVLEWPEALNNSARACREWEVPRSTFYRWKKAYAEEGKAGLIRKRPVAKSHPRQLPPEVIEKIIHLWQQYHFGPQRITWYIQRYHGVTTSCSSVYRTLVRQGMSRLPRNAGRRAIHTRRYAKQVPGHHVQVDVKSLTLKSADGKKVRRFQYTAIDDATRIRALKI